MQKIYHNLKINNMSTVDQFISILEARIHETKEKLKTEKDFGVLEGYLLALQHCLSTYKLLNDR